MFSFHKPKIYRSLQGCCICKAKSSSSRFTDSKKYEAEFEKCFLTKEKRSGDICNACVLLVKRWKKLPPGTGKDWRHVVDSRDTSNGKVSGGRGSSSLRRHHSTKPKKPMTNDDMLMGVASPDRSDSSDEDNIDEDYYMSDHEDFDGNDSRDKGTTKNTKRQHENESNEQQRSRGRAAYLKMFKKRSLLSSTESFDEAFTEDSADERISSFLDMTFWRREKICCGVIFKGPNNEVVINPKLFKPCSCRLVESNKPSPSSLPSSIAKTPNGSNSSDNLSLSSSSFFSPSRLEEDNESNASSSNSVP